MALTLSYSFSETQPVRCRLRWMQQMLRLWVTVNPIWSHMLRSSFLPQQRSLISAMYSTLRMVVLLVGVGAFPVHVFQKRTEMLLVHLGPVMQIRPSDLQDKESSPLTTRSRNLSASPSHLIRLLVQTLSYWMFLFLSYIVWLVLYLKESQIWAARTNTYC